MPRQLDLSGLPVAPGYVYTLTAGTVSVQYLALAAGTGTPASTAQDVVNGLRDKINLAGVAAHVTATAITSTVATEWITADSATTGVLEALAAQITADGQLTASTSGTTLTLTSVSSNVPFTVNAVYATPSTAFVGDPGAPLVQAGRSATQLSKIVFVDDTLAGDDFSLTAGTTFTASFGENTYYLDTGNVRHATYSDGYTAHTERRSYSVTIGQNSVAANWTSILSNLASQIQTGENSVAVQNLTDPTLRTLLTVTPTPLSAA